MATKHNLRQLCITTRSLEKTEQLQIEMDCQTKGFIYCLSTCENITDNREHKQQPRQWPQKCQRRFSRFQLEVLYYGSVNALHIGTFLCHCLLNNNMK